jgi:PleD family two-component response regulator
VDEPSTAELHDHVTGLPRRSVAEQAIAELCDDNARAKEPISVALMDLSLAALYARDEVAAERELLRMVSVMTSLLRFTDLLARIDTHRFMVVMPATAQSVAAATVSAVAHAVSSIATAACEGRESDWVTSAVVTVMPDRRCAGESVFSSAEALLEETRAAGEAFGARELD